MYRFYQDYKVSKFRRLFSDQFKYITMKEIVDTQEGNLNVDSTQIGVDNMKFIFIVICSYTSKNSCFATSNVPGK